MIRQGREGISGDGLEGDFWVEKPPSCIKSQLERLHGWTVHNFSWQFVPVQDCSNGECMLAATGFTLLLVNLESMTSKPKASGGIKNVSYGMSRNPFLLKHIVKIKTKCKVSAFHVYHDNLHVAFMALIGWKCFWWNPSKRGIFSPNIPMWTSNRPWLSCLPFTWVHCFVKTATTCGGWLWNFWWPTVMFMSPSRTNKRYFFCKFNNKHNNILTGIAPIRKAARKRCK